jgi:signal transduction histidine kinase
VRRRLVVGAAAITLTIVLAFAIPLGLLIQRVAHDRAVVAAQRSAQALLPVLSVAPSDADRVIQGLNAGGAAQVSVIDAHGHVLGPPAPVDAAVVAARRRASTISVRGGQRVLVPVVVPNGSIDVISVFVPDAALQHGVASAWILLAVLSLSLLVVVVVAADRVARGVVRPVADLAHTAERLGAGDLDARVEPAGPPEIVEVGHTLNRLAGRIVELLAAERELVADLSHRLRTPITALRLDAEALADERERQRVGNDVGEVVRAVDEIIAEARRQVSDDDPPRCDLVPVTAARLAFWQVLAEEQHRSVELTLPPGPALAPVRPADLEAALDALVGNVISHTPEGVAVSVEVGGDPTAGWWLAVVDHGPGFGSGRLDRGSSGAGSTGLGLDIARRTAEAAGGRLDLGRADHGGAAVTLHFGPLPTS